MVRKVVRTQVLQALHLEEVESFRWYFQNVLVAQVERTVVEPLQQSVQAQVVRELQGGGVEGLFR